ncbi:uncharacterized protein [Diabrotica undecimpunctata]|uniref:uncharacterized protein n=1 Tax=Diabrotica undecimpunctata TaxID=50387 RepID=UPI003B639C9B
MINQENPAYCSAVKYTLRKVITRYLEIRHFPDNRILKISCIRLNEALYNTNWVYWNESNRKLLLVLLLITSRPMLKHVPGICLLDFNLAKQVTQKL